MHQKRKILNGLSDSPRQNKSHSAAGQRT
ncbi:MAG: hypothetical protein RL240_1100, partial [Planctomycetota bacterium]